MKYIDTHAHLSCAQLYPCAMDIIERAHKAGVERFLIICTSFEELERAQVLQSRVGGIDLAFGVYPCDSDQWNQSVQKRLGQLIKDQVIVAIGEIGLDYHYDEYRRDEQIQCFKGQLDIANEYDLPILIHMRDATKDTLEILKHYPNIRGIMHCFSGSIETMEEILKSKLYISFAGVITFKNAVGIKDIVKAVPLERMMIETDCPYLTPHPFRGKINEPMYLTHTFDQVAEIKQCDKELLSKQLICNYESLFNNRHNTKNK